MVKMVNFVIYTVSQFFKRRGLREDHGSVGSWIPGLPLTALESLHVSPPSPAVPKAAASCSHKEQSFLPAGLVCFAFFFEELWLGFESSIFNFSNHTAKTFVKYLFS